MELMLLTFVRTSELLEAKWEEFKFNDRVWIIPLERMKMRKPHIVPLSDQVLNLLGRLKQINIQSDYVFPSPLASRKPMSENTILYALYRMGYKERQPGMDSELWL